MKRDEGDKAERVAEYPRAVPDPDPEESVAHLRMIIRNATQTFGAESSTVAELREKLANAEKRAGQK